MPATLTVKRESLILELRRMPIEIAVDGTAAGRVERHGTFETAIEPGHHTLQVRAGRYTSAARTFEAAEGDAVGFRCSGARIWPIYLASFLIPSLALTLKRD